jgi:hypothetical protein
MVATQGVRAGNIRGIIAVQTVALIVHHCLFKLTSMFNYINTHL